MVAIADCEYFYDVASYETHISDCIRYDEAILVNPIPVKADDRVPVYLPVDSSAPKTATSKSNYRGSVRYVDFDEY